MISEKEKAIRRRLAAQKLEHFPVIEYALDVLANGGPDLRCEAEELHSSLKTLSKRMIDDLPPCSTTPGEAPE